MKAFNVLPVLFVASLLFPLDASAQTADGDRVWTTVGSAGTLDEKSVDKVFFDHAIVQKGTPLVVSQARRQRSDGYDPTDSAVIRYNVTAVDGLFGAESIGMSVRFLDENANVIVQLVEVDLATGAEVTRLTFDSDDPQVPPANGYQVWDVYACGKETFDFVKKAYYLEATLTTSEVSANTAAGIQIIQLRAVRCGG